ncbi:MAG: serine/threonine-protein kinase [Acidimicrobiales bacterium]
MPGSLPGAPGAPPTPPVPPGFELLHPLGGTATSRVWSARSLATGAVVALKWVSGGSDDEGAEALRREAEVLAGLDHPNVARLLDLLELPGGDLVLVTEHAPGGSLAELLARRGRLTAPEVVDLGTALASALGAAHRGRVLHRDVKPANVLLAADGSPLLADFGVAWAAGRRRRLGRTDVVGTAEYLDPAVAAGGPADARADLYALGVTLYEALAGDVPHAGSTPEAVLHAAAMGDHVPLRDAARDAADHVVDAVERATARDPRHRQPDAAALAADLLGTRPAATGSLPWDPPSSRPQSVTSPTGEASALLPLDGRADPPHRPTRSFGPRPPRHGNPVQVLRRAALLVPLVALVVTAAVLLSPLSPLNDEGDDAGGAVPVTAPPCPPIEREPGLVAADLDGDGCPTALRWDGAVLEVPEGAGVPAARYAIGRPGDVLLFGDWDCDGIVTPAVHRPDAGKVIVFDRWAVAGSPLQGRTSDVEPGSSVTVAEGDDGCDVLVAQR